MVGGERLTFPIPVCCCWFELVGNSSRVLRTITAVEHLQRVGSDLSRRDSIATVATSLAVMQSTMAANRLASGTLLPEEGWRGREIFGLAKEESRVKGLGNGYF